MQSNKGKTLIIAEAGVNHNGDYDLACKLALEAKKAGADIVKYQTFKTENIVSNNAIKAKYQIESTGNKESQFEMLKKLELSENDFTNLKKYCDEIGIDFLSTPFDIRSINFLNSLVKLWKIPSGEITNYPYLVEIAKTHKPVIMSTGMSNAGEIEDAIKVLNDNGTKDIKLLHCNTEYPTPYEDVNLNVINSMKNRYGVDVGYSDHTIGIEVPIAAVALGATIIEKHFTIDRNMDGPDHKASLEPNELKLMINSIRNIEKALGDSNKCVTKSEEKNRDVVRKSIVALTNIKKGDVFSDRNITTKRPGNGISPMKWTDVIGRKAIRDFKEDELIEL